MKRREIGRTGGIKRSRQGVEEPGTPEVASCFHHHTGVLPQRGGKP